MKTTYIGFDLGDGDTIANFVNSDGEDVIKEIQDIQMPETQYSGTAIATAYAYKKNTTNIVFSPYILKNEDEVENIHTNFKRRPTDLLKQGAINQWEEIERLFDNTTLYWPSESIVQSISLENYRNQVVEYINAIFQNTEFQERMKIVLNKTQNMVVCIGHPTNWNSLDCAIYKKILNNSLLGEKKYLGHPLEIIVAGESRAAFLYAKYANSIQLVRNQLYLLIDVGSSTIDLTALTGDSRNSTYNSGNNYLGSRLIDYLILEWYLSEINELGFRDEYDDIIKYNPTASKALLLKCRKAKEELFSTKINRYQIEFGSWKTIKLQKTTLEQLLEQPIVQVMDEYLNYPQQILKQFGNKSWKQAFYDFLITEASSLKSKGILVNTIILTGSASQMPIVETIVKQVFHDALIYPDADPSKTISKGLSLVGQSNVKSLKFQQDVRKLIREGVPEVIENNLSFLAEQLGKTLSDIICDDIIMPKLRGWKNMKYTTMKEAVNDIESSCSEHKIGKLLTTHTKCKRIIQNWIVDKVSIDIAVKLKELCNKYQVNDFTLNDLNVMDFAIDSNVNGAGLSKDMINSILSPADMLSSIVAVITGILVAIITPTLLGVVIAIISYISVTIAAIIFAILAAIPLWGWGILLAITGYSAARLVSQGWDSVKDSISDKIINANLPKKVRDMVKESKLNEAINKKRSTINNKIKESMLSISAKNKIKVQISTSLEKQVQLMADEIKYVIESF